MDKQFADVDREVRTLVSSKLRTAVPPAELEDELYMGTASGFDSSKLLEFILSLEERFNFVVPDEDLTLENFDSISKISRYILHRTQTSAVS
jgi:acyl carrier protein